MPASSPTGRVLRKGDIVEYQSIIVGVPSHRYLVHLVRGQYAYLTALTGTKKGKKLGGLHCYYWGNYHRVGTVEAGS